MSARHTPPTAPRRGAIYRRVSSKDQAADDKHSLAEQLENICRPFAEQHNITVGPDDIYTDDTTAKNGVEELPELDRLLARADDGEYDVVILDKLDRLTRAGQGDYWLVIRRLDHAEVILYAVTNDFASDNRADLLRGDLAAYSAHEDNTMRTINVRRGRRNRVRRDKLPAPGRDAPYGWEWVDPFPTAPRQPAHTKLRHNPAEVEWLRRLADHLDAGGTYHTACVLANKGRAPRVPDTGWHPGHVRDIMLNPTNWGEYYAYRFATIPVTLKDKRAYFKKHGKKLKSNYRYIDLYYAAPEVKARFLADTDTPYLTLLPGVLMDGPIISKERVERFSARAGDNRAHAHTLVRRYTPDDVMLSGREVRCAYCLRGLNPTSRSENADQRGRRHRRRADQPWRYVCARGANPSKPCPGGGVEILASKLDAVVWDTVCRAIRDEDYLCSLIEDTDQVTKPKALVDYYRGQIAHLEAERARWVKRIGKLDEDTNPQDASDADLYRREQHALDVQIEQMQRQLERAEDTLTQSEQRRRVLAEFQQYARAQRDHLTEFTAAQRAAILRHLRVQIFVGAGVLRSEQKRVYEIIGYEDDGRPIRAEITPPRIAITLNLTQDAEAAQRIARDWRNYYAYDPAADSETNMTLWFRVLDGQPAPTLPPGVVDFSMFHEESVPLLQDRLPARIDPADPHPPSSRSAYETSSR